MKTRFLLLISALTLALSAAAEKPAQILERCANQIRTARSLSANFSVAGPNVLSSGSITLAGEKFRISSSDLTVWYDGTTQWSYMPSAKEVDISEPTPGELQEINPFAIINTLRKAYVAKAVKSAKDVHKLSLTAKNAKAQVTKVDLTIDAKTMWPKEIVVYRKGSGPVTVKVSDVKIGMGLAVSYFQFDKSKYKGVEIVDLR